MNTVETDFNRHFIRVRLESDLDLDKAMTIVQEIFFQIEMFKGQCFRVLLDFREADPLPPDVASVWVDVAKQARALGLVKSARLLSPGGMRDIVKRVAKEAGNDDLVMDFTDEDAAVYWLTNASSRPLA